MTSNRVQHRFFAHAREMPLSLRDAHSREIYAKIAAKLYEKVEHLEWASITHFVIKKERAVTHHRQLQANA